MCPHVPPWGREVSPDEPSTEPGSDPSPAMVAWSVLSKVTSAPCTPGDSLLLPSQLTVEALVTLAMDVRWKNVTFTGWQKKKKEKNYHCFQGASWLFLAQTGAWRALVMLFSARGSLTPPT